MKILDFFRRSTGRKRPALPPIRMVRPPGDVRAANQARLAKEFEESGIFPAGNQSADEFMDTGSLELQKESGDVADPYETHSWEMDPEEGLRRVEDQTLVNRQEPPGTPDNPYDTVTRKKGW